MQKKTAVYQEILLIRAKMIATMDRRKLIALLPTALAASSALTGCDSESKPSASATLVNNGKVHDAFTTIEAIADDLGDDAVDFSGGSNWRDVVEQLREHIEQLHGAIDDLRGALGYE